MELVDPVAQRRTFAIISHPDAGKTTLTEQILLLGGAIQTAGTVRARKASRHATSDWMEMERERGISITTSVMQFPYAGHIFNLLDTPGHEDFSEDTYRTLTAVDSAIMIIDAAKGVEARTLQLMQICRMRNTPILTFINKVDREIRPLVSLFDEIEQVLEIPCVPMTLPIGQGRSFAGIYDREHAQLRWKGDLVPEATTWPDPMESQIRARLAMGADQCLAEFELLLGATVPFSPAAFLAGAMTPVYCGAALQGVGVADLLSAMARYAPSPAAVQTQTRLLDPTEATLTGFIFKIQANMDPLHRDRIAFMRICSGKYTPGVSLYNMRTQKEQTLNRALTFMAGAREAVEEGVAGDIIGIYNHGTIRIGDTLTSGEKLKFSGVPHFAPELFKSVRTQDPLKSKALLKGLTQLCEEGATQLFRPFEGSQWILGAIGALQFEVVAHRLLHEYRVPCVFEPLPMRCVRWIESTDPVILKRFETQYRADLAEDAGGRLVYFASSQIQLDLMIQRWPDLRFHATCELCD